MAEVSSTSESSFAAQVVEDSFAVDRSCDQIAGVETCLLVGGLGCSATTCIGHHPTHWADSEHSTPHQGHPHVSRAAALRTARYRR